MAGRPKPRPAVERARAAARLAADGPLLPIADLTRVAGMSANAVRRWITYGRSGVYLDGVKDPLLGLCSTRAAVARAEREYADKVSARAAQKGGAA